VLFRLVLLRVVWTLRGLSSVRIQNMAEYSHSTTSHTLSTTRSAFPILTPDLHSTLSNIVARVPPGSSSFSDLFKAYNNVVVHPQDDIEIYGAILKLALERGIDFRQKWASVLAAQGLLPRGSTSQGEEIRSGGDNERLDALKARLDELDRAAGKSLETPMPLTRRLSIIERFYTPEGPHPGARSTSPSRGPRIRTVTRVSRSASAERHRTRIDSSERQQTHNTPGHQSPIVDHHIRRHDRPRSLPLTSTPVKSRWHVGHRSSPSGSTAAYTPTVSDSHWLPSHQTRKADRFRRVSLLGRALDVWRDRAVIIQVRRRPLNTRHAVLRWFYDRNVRCAQRMRKTLS
jgi:hypothetical protein